jgi:hypothetical protein
MLRALLPQFWHQLFGGQNRSRTVNRKSRSVRLTVERLEERDVPSLVHGPMLGPQSPVPVGDIIITSVSLVNANDQPLTGVYAGEQVYVQANFTTQGLPSYASYRVSYAVNGLTKETGDLTWGAGSSGTGSWIAYWGSWTAAVGTNQVTVTTSYADNTKSFSFTVPSLVHRGPMLGPHPPNLGPAPALPPALGAIHLYPQVQTPDEVDWYLENTSTHAISVTYRVADYYDGSTTPLGPIDTYTIQLSPGQSQDVAAKTKTLITGDYYQETVTLVSAYYLN